MRKKSRHPPPSAKHSREMQRLRKLTSEVESSPSLSAFRVHRPSLSLSRSSLLLDSREHPVAPASLFSHKSIKHTSLDAGYDESSSTFLDFGALHRELLEIKT